MHSHFVDHPVMVHKRIVDHVAAQLRKRLQQQLQDLRITMHDDGLILRGRVPTFYVKQVAQHVAMEVSGLSIAANELKVSRCERV